MAKKNYFEFVMQPSDDTMNNTAPTTFAICLQLCF